MTRHRQGFIRIHPSGLSQPVTPGWNGGILGHFLRLRTPRLLATHAEAGTSPAHWLGSYTFDTSRTSLVIPTLLKRPRVARSSSATTRCSG
jgi:hypothetical protein